MLKEFLLLLFHGNDGKLLKYEQVGCDLEISECRDTEQYITIDLFRFISYIQNGTWSPSGSSPGGDELVHGGGGGGEDLFGVALLVRT